MPIYNIGSPLKTLTDEQHDGTQTYKNMTMKSNMSREKQTFQQTRCHSHQELTKEEMITRKSSYCPHTSLLGRPIQLARL
jgi:hypothetical protein